MPEWIITLLSVIVGGLVTAFSQEMFKVRDMRRERERAFFEDDREKLAQLETVVAHYAHDQLLDPTSLWKDDMQILYRIEYSFFPYQGFDEEVNRLILLRAQHAKIASKTDLGESLSEIESSIKDNLGKKTGQLGKEMVFKARKALQSPSRATKIYPFEKYWQNFRSGLPWNIKKE